jgi:peroxiredoxin
MNQATAHPLQAGATAPDFALASTSGQTVTLSSFLGQKHVLLAFFPLAFTGTCTAEVCAFSEDFDEFTGYGVEVLPISVDAVPSLKEFKKAYSLKVDLLSDFKRDASRAYGTLRDDTFFSNRAYFLVDTTGIIRWAHVEDPPSHRRENSEIFAEIRKLVG